MTDTHKCIYTSRNLIKTAVNSELPLDIVDIIFKRRKIKLDNYVIFQRKADLLLHPIIFNGDVVGSIIFIFECGKITMSESSFKNLCRPDTVRARYRGRRE